MAYDWNRQELARSPWRKEVVPYIPGILIQRAKAGRVISYAELADELEARYGLESKARKTLYGPPVGAVGFAVRDLAQEWGERIPPLNLIVVQASTGLPGVGADEVAHYFFDDGGAGMARNRRAYIEAAVQAVFDYGSRWDRVALALGVEVPTSPAPGDDEGQVIPLPIAAAAYRPESHAHKALKAWAAQHPEVFEDYGAFTAGGQEHGLSSGDRLDVYFSNGRERLAVEVKASNASNDELERGIYQCIKYRAVLRAESIALRKPALGDAVLVSTRALHREGRALAKRLYVDFIRAPSEAEH
ncbi:hypothetical protein [Luteimonas sp. MHLX1A]|uniref:hypothetical protein n=1 Tax=Alterluteimonas muca TaxID=2878684 RepID=UPI001E50F14D|nr:hypothetical protein [Luteimonas sp. MHLX1A]MCD9046761.1 hypothetical protein [Luteimonas sp. MHLX1A]